MQSTITTIYYHESTSPHWTHPSESTKSKVKAHETAREESHLTHRYSITLPPQCTVTVLLPRQCMPTVYVCCMPLPTRLHTRQYTLLCSVAKRAPYVCVLLVPCLLSVSQLGVSKGVRLHGVD